MHCSQLVLLLVSGLCAGFIDSIGGGGGMLTVPTLLSLGLPPHITLGTNKLAGTFGTFRAALTFIRRGIVQPGLWKIAAVSTFVGACSGTVLVYLLSADFLKRFLPFAIMLVAVYVAWPKQNKNIRHTDDKPGKLVSSFLGYGLGFYDGFLGPGTGAMWTGAVMGFFNYDLVGASGVARLMNFVSNITALLVFMGLKQINYLYGICLGGAVMVGAYFGSHLAITHGAKFIRPLFLIFVVGFALKLLIAG